MAAKRRRAIIQRDLTVFLQDLGLYIYFFPGPFLLFLLSMVYRSSLSKQPFKNKPKLSASREGDPCLVQCH